MQALRENACNHIHTRLNYPWRAFTLMSETLRKTCLNTDKLKSVFFRIKKENSSVLLRIGTVLQKVSRYGVMRTWMRIIIYWNTEKYGKLQSVFRHISPSETFAVRNFISAKVYSCEIFFRVTVKVYSHEVMLY